MLRKSSVTNWEKFILGLRFIVKSWAPKINIFFEIEHLLQIGILHFKQAYLVVPKHEQHKSPSSSLARQTAVFLLQNTILRMLSSKKQHEKRIKNFNIWH